MSTVSTLSLGRVRHYGWHIVQTAVAAHIDWLLAHTVLGLQQPFLAPIAAVVALAALAVGVGERGTQAAQMLVGVAVGVATVSCSCSLTGRGRWR